jgi:hypothetical protein
MDMKTVILSYIISNAICAVIMAVLWFQNRHRFEGLGFWLVDYFLQLAGLLLVALRGVVPDFLSMPVGNLSGIGTLYRETRTSISKRYLAGNFRSRPHLFYDRSAQPGLAQSQPLAGFVFDLFPVRMAHASPG